MKTPVKNILLIEHDDPAKPGLSPHWSAGYDDKNDPLGRSVGSGAVATKEMAIGVLVLCNPEDFGLEIEHTKASVYPATVPLDVWAALDTLIERCAPQITIVVDLTFSEKSAWVLTLSLHFRDGAKKTLFCTGASRVACGEKMYPKLKSEVDKIEGKK